MKRRDSILQNYYMSKLPKYQGKKGSSEIKPRRASFTSLPGMGLLSVIGKEAQRQGLTNQYDIRNTMLNPKNWFPNDYSKLPTFDKAYQAARQQGEKEFIWKGKRYSGEYAGTPEEQLRQTGITNQQLQNKSWLDERLHRNLNPVGYGSIPGMLNRLSEAIIENEPSRARSISEDLAETGDRKKQNRLDAYYLYQGYPQRFNTFSISKYKPGKSEDKNATYYSINDDFGQAHLLHTINFTPEGKPYFNYEGEPVGSSGRPIKGFRVDKYNNVMGQYRLGLGEDEKGKYISYYDIWDLAPVDQRLNMDFGKPFEVYDRVYYKNVDGKAVPLNAQTITPTMKLEKTTQFVPKKKSGGWLEEYNLPKYQGKTGSGEITDKDKLAILQYMQRGKATPKMTAQQFNQAVSKTKPVTQVFAKDQFYQNQLQKYGRTKEDIARTQQEAVLPFLLATGAVAAPLLAPAVASAVPAIGAGLSYAPIASAPGATLGNLLTSAGVAGAVTNLPNTSGTVQQAFRTGNVGDIGEAALNVGLTGLDLLPVYGPASRQIAKTAYNVSQHPLVSTLPYVVQRKAVPEYLGAAALAGINRLSPILSKNPLTKPLYKEAARRVGSYSIGANRNIREIVRALRGKLPQGSTGPYQGMTTTGTEFGFSPERNLIRNYIYQDARGFQESNLPLTNLRYYENRYGPLKKYKLDSGLLGEEDFPWEDLAGEAVQAKKFPFPEELAGAKTMEDVAAKIREIAKREGMVGIGSDSSVVGYDDVAGNMKYVIYDPVTDSYKVRTQDIWKFTPEDYNPKWSASHDRLDLSETGANVKAYLNQYMKSKQASLMDKAGKPFVLLDERPLSTLPKQQKTFQSLSNMEDIGYTEAELQELGLIEEPTLFKGLAEQTKNALLKKLPKKQIGSYSILNPEKFKKLDLTNFENLILSPKTSILKRQKSGGPLVNPNGYKDGRPSKGSNWRIPGNTVYNPTGETILAQANTGEQTILQPYDTNSVTFQGADYIDEYHLTDAQPNWLDDYKAKLGGPYNSSWMLTNPKPEPVYVPKMQRAGEPERLIERVYYLTPSSGTRQPIYTSDPRDPRLRNYQDSLNLYKVGLSEINAYGGIGNDNQPKLNAKQKEENLRDVRNAIKNIIKPYSAESSITTTAAKTDGRNIFFKYIDEKTGKSFWRQSGYNANIAPDRYIKPKEHPDYFPYYKKPVQPVVYKKPELEKPDGVDLPEEIQFKDLPQPKGGYKSAAPAPQMISETPTKFSYTYPSGNQQKTIYFSDKGSWKAFTDQFDGLNTTEQAGSFSATPGMYTRERRPNPVFENIEYKEGGWLREYQDAGTIVENTFTPYSRNYLNNLRNEWVATYNKPIPYRISKDDRFDDFFDLKIDALPKFYETKSGWVKINGPNDMETFQGTKDQPPKKMGKPVKGVEWLENYKVGPYEDKRQRFDLNRLIKSIRNTEYDKPIWNRDVKFVLKNGGQHGGLDRWFAEKWVDVKSGKPCGRQEGESRAYPACRPSKRVSSKTPKTSSELSSEERARFKSSKTSSQRIPYSHKRRK